MKYRKFIKFACVALGYNLFAYTIYAALLLLNCNYLFASLCSFIVGITLSYFMNKMLVFITRNHEYGLILRYVTFYLLLLGFNLLALHLLVEIFKINPYIAQVLVTFFSAFLSYNVMRVIVFRR